VREKQQLGDFESKIFSAKPTRELEKLHYMVRNIPAF
jgi:hypothetical protein